MENGRHIITYDTTLRDGEQGEGISFSLEDKLAVVQRLDAFGIDIIEGGFPASNPKDIEFFRRVRTLPLAHARVAAFGSTCRKDTLADQDQGLADLIASGAPVVTIVGKAAADHVEHALQTTLGENLRMVRDSVAYLVAAGVEVVFDAEHYFDGYLRNPDYTLAVARAAYDAGASALGLCETNGGLLPDQVRDIVTATAAALPGATLGVHCHNDAGCAVANTLAGVGAGAAQVQGTVNGFGERAGNADLLTVIADLQLKLGYDCVPDLSQLTDVANFVAETCNVTLPANTPYTGAAAFTHKGGLHVSAIARYPHAYEHIEPEVVGNRQSVLVSELAGRASLLAKARRLGYDLSDRSELVQEILDDVKEREARGYSFEVADGSLALLILGHLGLRKPHFTLESFRVIVDDREDADAWAAGAESEATIKIHVGDKRYVATGEGVGPVGALDTALRMVLGKSYPQIAEFSLVDFKVRIIDGSVGTGAVTRVTIVTSDGDRTWGTVGVSENIIEASWNALVDSIEYALDFRDKPARRA